MKSLFRYIIFLILLNFSFAAKAESVYPIQLYAAMLPPYTNCLGDYINGDMNRLKLSAVVRDMTKHGSTMSISVLMRVPGGSMSGRPSMTMWWLMRGRMTFIMLHLMFGAVTRLQ